MPILAIPVVNQPDQTPVERDRSRDETRTLALRALDGTYPFLAGDGDFIFGPDSEGLDMPPREVIRRRVPGMEGSRLSEIRTDEREVFLPFYMAGVTHLDYLAKRDELAGLFNYRNVDYRSTDGTLDLVAESARGQRYLRCTYLDGMRQARWPVESSTWARLGITMLAVRPYWTGPRWQAPTMRVGMAVSWFGTFPGGITAGNVIGSTAAVTVDGDAESWVTVDVVGPATSLTLAGDTGFLLSVPGGLAAGEVFHYESDPRSRTAEFSGVKNSARIGPSTRPIPLNPGTRTLTLALAGATAQTSVSIGGDTHFERPW